MHRAGFRSGVKKNRDSPVGIAAFYHQFVRAGSKQQQFPESQMTVTVTFVGGWGLVTTVCE